MLKLNLNKLKYIKICARENGMKRFDGYGDEL